MTDPELLLHTSHYSPQLSKSRILCESTFVVSPPYHFLTSLSFAKGHLTELTNHSDFRNSFESTFMVSPPYHFLTSLSFAKGCLVKLTNHSDFRNSFKSTFVVSPPYHFLTSLSFAKGHLIRNLIPCIHSSLLM